MDDKELEAFEIAALIIRKLNGQIDPKDEEILESWKLKSDSNLKLYNELSGELSREQQLTHMGRFDTKAALERVIERIDTPVIPLRRRKTLLIRIAAAATILVVLSIGLYINRQHSVRQHTFITKNDVPPGGNKAVLTLNDGRNINVDDVTNGTIAQQSGVSIRKISKGQLIYTIASGGALPANIDYNTVSTPNGGQYQVILPDGTKVWLNSASSLRYPTRFEGSQRLVTLTGEGYFEVAHNNIMPFIVNCANQSVRVLGTHFNIHSYPNEAVVTTLLEGSVKVKSTANNIHREFTLKPGQQLTHLEGQFNVSPADIARNVAWKNGQFIFHNTDLTTIMREVQRWYDVKVDLVGLPDERYNAVIRRDVQLSKLLQTLELTSNLKFKISERRIMLQK